ncbi:MAG: redox-sensing transcriptional repressor Rex [Bacteroidetes bacterium]|nr:redox-sensing transcriptional repressor Rex [Bacteroidota bacterium]
MKLPKKTVQRLSRYRRLLYKYRYLSEPYIYSHDLARLLNLNPVQVRRDLMLIGSAGNHRKGYNVNELNNLIGEIIDSEGLQKVAIVGAGRLGQAIMNYVADQEMNLKVAAVFDIDTHKIGKKFSDVECYDISKVTEVVPQKGITIGIIAVPSEFATSIADILLGSGVEGILNFSSVHLDLPKSIYLKEFDIITTLEEMAYFVKNK